MRKYLLLVFCVLIAVGGCSRKWNNPAETATPLPGSSQLLVPANNAWIWNTQNIITFAWSKIDGATKYKLLLSNYSTISDSFLAIEVADTFYNWTDTNKLGKIYWQVKAWNPINEWKVSNINVFEKGPYSVGKIFTTLLHPPTPESQIIYNNYFYLFYDLEIAIYDVSDYSNPIYIKNVIYPNLKAIINNNLLYVLTGNGVSIASLSDPLNPTEIGYITNSTQTPTMNMGIAIKDTIAYVVNFYDGLHVLNIKNPNNPVYITSCILGKYAFDIAISGNYAYIANGDSGLTVIDISNPKIPLVLNSLYYAQPIYSVYVNGSALYATGYKFTIVTPESPIIVNEDNNFWFSKLISSSGYLFAGMRIYQDNNIGLAIGKCNNVNGDTLASFSYYDIENNYMFCQVRYYKYVNDAAQDIGSGVCVYKVAPFSVTK